MKKLLALLLALSLSATLAACGGTKDPPPSAPESSQESMDDGASSSQPDDALDDPAASPEGTSPDASLEETEKPAQKPAEKPAEKPVEKPSSQPSEKPVEKPAEKPSGSGSSSAAATVDLEAFFTDSVDSRPDMPQLMKANQEIADSFYPGLADISTKQSLVYITMISAAIGELALVEVEDSGDVQKVKDLFQARIDAQVGTDENPGGAWYPASIEGWKNDSAIASNGNFVMLIVGDQKDSVVEAFNALFA